MVPCVSDLLGQWVLGAYHRFLVIDSIQHALMIEDHFRARRRVPSFLSTAPGE